MDTREWYQVGLELSQVDVEGAIKAEAGSNRADNLGNQAVKMLEAGARNVKVTTADIVHSLVIYQEGTIRVLNSAVGG